MSRDLQDFVSAFGTTASIANRVRSRWDQQDRWNVSKQNPYSTSNDPNGELARHDNYSPPGGFGGGFKRIGRKLGNAFSQWSGGMGGQPSAVPMPQQPATPGVDYGDQSGVYDNVSRYTAPDEYGAEYDMAGGGMTPDPEYDDRYLTPIERLQRATGSNVYTGATSAPEGAIPTRYEAVPMDMPPAGVEDLRRYGGGRGAGGTATAVPAPVPVARRGASEVEIPNPLPVGYRPAAPSLAATQGTTTEDGMRNLGDDGPWPNDADYAPGGPDANALPGNAPQAVPMATPASESNFGPLPARDGATSASPGGAPARPGATAPASGPAPGGAGGGGRAGVTPTGKRKPLNDQTRVEAFNPDDPQDVAESDQTVKDAINGGLMYAQRIFHLDGSGAAVPGTDPHTAKGQKAFMQGVGAPDPQTVQQLDQIVQQKFPNENFGGPGGQSKMAIRRMEIVYRNMVQTGQTEKANKMAFEIMQYSAGVASQLGTQAVQLYKGGNIRAATEATVRAYDAVPDGRNVAIGPDGKTAIVTNQSGKVLDQIQFTPQQVFQAAMGLSNRSLYWQLLAGRAQMTPEMIKGANAGAKSAVDAKRIELMDARINKLKQPAKGRAAAGPPQTGVTSSMLADVDGMTGLGSKSSAPVPQGGGEAAIQPDEAEQDALSGGEGDAVTNGVPPRPALEPATPNQMPAAAVNPLPPGGAPVAAIPPPAEQGPPSPTQIAAGAKPTVPQKSGDISTEKTIGVEIDGKHYVLPTIVGGKSLTPDAAVEAFRAGKNQPVGTFDSEEEATAFAENRSRELDAAFGGKGTLKKGPSEPAAGGLIGTPREVPDVTVDEDGTPIAKGKAEPFAEPNPLDQFKGKNPYAQMLAGIDPRTGKASPELAAELTAKGKNLKSGILAQKQALDKKVIDWNKAKSQHEKDFKAAQAAERKDAITQNRAGVNRLTMNPEAVSKYETDLKEVFDTRAKAVPEGTTNIYNDGHIPTEKLVDLGLTIATHNRDVTQQRAATLVGSLTRIDPENKDARAFTPLGKDESGKNVRLKIGDDILMMPMPAFKKLNTLIDQRWDAKAKKPPAEAGLTERGLKVAKDALPTGKEAADYVFKGGVLKDVGRVGMAPARKAFEAAGAVRRAIKDIPPGATFDPSILGP